MNDINYIKFLLIGDEFDISRLLRSKAKYVGMDTLYDNDCDYIARAFNLYDTLSGNCETIPMYDSLVKFLTLYDTPITDVLTDIEIELFDIIRSDYE